jgi:hypothetical protein
LGDVSDWQANSHEVALGKLTIGKRDLNRSFQVK